MIFVHLIEYLVDSLLWRIFILRYWLLTLQMFICFFLRFFDEKKKEKEEKTNKYQKKKLFSFQFNEPTQLRILMLFEINLEPKKINCEALLPQTVIASVFH